MGVIMQAFYWNCPEIDNKEFAWWPFVQEKTKSLADIGFSALWLPPASKAANISGPSMGYDPYDFYDLGEFDQKGGIPTWFGTRQALEDLIKEAHDNGLQVYADMVLNHTSGADAQELNEFDNQTRWTKYSPASGKFPRDWKCYHPSWFKNMDQKEFEGMPDLCHRNPYVYSETMEYVRWLIEDIGFDGLRYDFVKGYGKWLISAILERLYVRNGKTNFHPFGVGEFWDSHINISAWVREINAEARNPVSAFDFPLRYRLRDMCMHEGFGLRTLTQPGTLLTDGLAARAVTFVENHDVVRDDAIIENKMLAYAFILTHEGYPCVFWQDYYNWGLALKGFASGIAALVAVHKDYAGGATDILYCDDDLYIMQRRGFGDKQGLLFVLNKAHRWNGRHVFTQWANTNLIPKAWRGKDNIDIPSDKWTDGNGASDFWAPPMGYAVYIPA
jgi:alpha-amylase